MNKSISVLLTTATLLSGGLLTSTVQAIDNTATIKPISVQQKQTTANDVVVFKDQTIKAGATMSLMSILGHFPSNDEFTQENLNKITTLFTPNGSAYPTTLEDFKYMPNLETIDIRYFSSGEKNLDPTPIGQLKNLKEFQFNTYMLSNGGGLTSLSPFKENKNLTTFGYHGTSITDASDSSLDDITSLENLEYTVINSNSEPTIGNLDHLPNLKTIGLHLSNLTTHPTLKQSTKLTSINFSGNNIEKIPDLSLFTDLKSLNYEFNALSDISNLKTVSNSLESLNLHKNNLIDSDILNITDKFQNLTTLNLSVNRLSQIPDLSYLKSLQNLDVSNNNIGNYVNLDKLNQMVTPPAINLQRNILTATPEDTGYKGNLDTWYNFIAGYGLPYQMTLKKIENQTVLINNINRLPIIFEWEDGYTTGSLFLTDFQKAFTDTKNMIIQTDNNNALVEKASANSINLIGLTKGTTKVTLSYGNNVKTEFTVSVQD
jgi:Leucine-rich repeat (LRR) protein